MRIFYILAIILNTSLFVWNFNNRPRYVVSWIYGAALFISAFAAGFVSWPALFDN